MTSQMGGSHCLINGFEWISLVPQAQVHQKFPFCNRFQDCQVFRENICQN